MIKKLLQTVYMCVSIYFIQLPIFFECNVILSADCYLHYKSQERFLFFKTSCFTYW